MHLIYGDKVMSDNTAFAGCADKHPAKRSPVLISIPGYSRKGRYRSQAPRGSNQLD